jgi:hypothetical protein
LHAGAEVLEPAATRTRPAKHWLVIAPARRNIVQVTRCMLLISRSGGSRSQPQDHDSFSIQMNLQWVKLCC